MALTWEKWRELFKGKWADVFEDAGVETGGEVTAENFEGVLPEEKGGLGADNFNQGRGNLMDITHLVTPENYNDISFWRGNPGITICMSRSSNSKDPPFGFGLILTTVVNTEMSQVFFRQASGEVLRRSGNGNGWNADPTLNGKDAWVELLTKDKIKFGQVSVGTIAGGTNKTLMEQRDEEWTNVPTPQQEIENLKAENAKLRDYVELISDSVVDLAMRTLKEV